MYSVIPQTYFHAAKLLVEARRDLKCTHQVHRKRIYESAQICNLLTVPLKYKSKIGRSVETVGLNVRPFCTDSGQSEKKSKDGQLLTQIPLIFVIPVILVIPVFPVIVVIHVIPVILVIPVIQVNPVTLVTLVVPDNVAIFCLQSHQSQSYLSSQPSQSFHSSQLL